MDQHDTPEKSYNLERLIFFTDGVFAIVITLLAIELTPPEGWNRTFSGLWSTEWRKITAYAISFFAVGMFWNAHRLMFGRIVRFHSGLVFFNLLLLGLVVLLPFTASLIFETGPTGEPFLIYLGLIAAIAAAQALTWGFAAFVARVVDPGLDRRAALAILLSQLAVPVLITLAALQVGRGGGPAGMLLAVPFLALLGFWRRRALRPARVKVDADGA